MCQIHAYLFLKFKQNVGIQKCWNIRHYLNECMGCNYQRYKPLPFSKLIASFLDEYKKKKKIAR